MFNKILVPLDGSELAEQALRPAVTLARKLDGEIMLLSAAVVKYAVVTETTGYGMSQVEEPHAYTHERLTSYLQEVQQKLSVYLQSSVKVVEGDAASVIVDAAVDEDVDLIVMSTHGRSGLSRWILGSVTEKVLRQAPCPVLVLHEATPLRNILITLDRSMLSEYALEPGLEIARGLGSCVTLLSAESDDEIDPRFFTELDKVESGLGGKARDDFYRRTEIYLQRTAKRLQPTVEQRIEIAPKRGLAAPTILDYIESHDIDLVVMATHGRTGLSRWRYGSVTEKVLHGAKCALLIVRPPLSEFE